MTPCVASPGTASPRSSGAVDPPNVVSSARLHHDRRLRRITLRRARSNAVNRASLTRLPTTVLTRPRRARATPPQHARRGARITRGPRRASALADDNGSTPPARVGEPVARARRGPRSPAGPLDRSRPRLDRPLRALDRSPCTSGGSPRSAMRPIRSNQTSRRVHYRRLQPDSRRAAACFRPLVRSPEGGGGRIADAGERLQRFLPALRFAAALRFAGAGRFAGALARGRFAAARGLGFAC